ncbi:MAG: hypothetical protein ACTSW1_13960 [Candidatus Hodarchaeales archaeon]
MPIKRLRGRREALTVNSELYKEKIIEYLESRGFFILSSSAVESDLPDLVFQHKFQENENWMEVKATSISLNESRFLAQLGDYLYEYLIRSPDNRFRFWLATYRFDTPEIFKQVFKDFNKEKILELRNKIIDSTSNKAREVIKNSETEDIILFFETAEIIEGEPFDLQVSKEKIAPSPPSKPKLSEVEYASEIKSNYDLVEPVIEQHTGFANLFPIDLPDTISFATTPYTSANQIFQENEYVQYPPFVLKNKTLVTFENLDDSILRRFVNIHTIKQIDINEWLQISENISNIIFLINLWIKDTCKKSNLWFDNRTRSYYFPKNQDNEQPIIRRWVTPKGISRDRELTKPYKKDEEINFWAHKAAQIRCRRFWNEFYIQIRPRWLFSEDGQTVLEGEKADKLDRYFRKRNFNRNKNLLYDTILWYELLFKDIRTTTLDRKEYDFFEKESPVNVKECLTFSLSRKPNSESEEEVEEDIDMVKLEEFMQ